MVSQVSSMSELSEYTNDPKKITVIDFTATWCGPCRTIGPIFERLAAAQEHTDLNFVKVDIDNASDVAAEFSIASVPTFAFLKGETEARELRFSGADQNKLKSTISQFATPRSSGAFSG